MDSLWRYVVKSLLDSDADLFVSAFDRYFQVYETLGFDFTTYLTHHHDRLALLRRHFVGSSRATAALAPVPCRP
jgi:hypothetical protein